MQQMEDDDKKSWMKGNISPTFTGTPSRGGGFSKNFVNPSFYSSSVLVPIEKKSVFSLTISTTETVHVDNKPYTVYIIKVKSDENHWEIIRRYKHFRVFSEKIQSEVSSLAKFEFPTKKLIGNMSPNFVKQRKDQLQRFLTSIQECSEAKSSRNLKVFLDPNFSPCLKSIVCPEKEGYLHLLRKRLPNHVVGKLIKKTMWKKVYCVVINCNLFYWKNRDQIYAEASGVIQLSHCITKIMEKDERKCIEINENQKNETTRENKWFLMKRKMKKKKFKLKKQVATSDVSPTLSSNNHNNNNNNMNNNIINNQPTSLDEEVFYFASDSDNSLDQWLQIIVSESSKLHNSKYSPAIPQPTLSPSSTTTTATSITNQQIPVSVSSPNLASLSISTGGSSKGHSMSSASSLSLSTRPINSNNNSSNNNQFFTMPRKKGMQPRGNIKLGTYKNVIVTNEGSSSSKVIYNNHEFTFDGTTQDDIDKDSIELLETTLSNTTYRDLVEEESNGNGVIPDHTKSSNIIPTTTPTASTLTPRSNLTNNLINNTNNNNSNGSNVKLNDKLKSKGPNNEIQLIANENVLYFTENIIHVHKKTGTIGSITITNYRFYFAAYYGSTKMAKKCETEGISVPLAMISKITKCTGYTLDKIKYYAFELKCKDFHRLKFMHLPGSSQHKANTRLYEILESLIFKSDYFKLFCFNNDEIIQNNNPYNGLKEFERMHLPNEEWRITHLNSDFYHSPTYPQVLVVPKKISDLELIAITQFRSKGRIPVLCWKSQHSPAVIVRCSQPVIGVTGKRSLEDEKLVEYIQQANTQSDIVYIMDARPQINAVANQVMGMGYENAKGNSHYTNCQLKFLGIENIHKMRECQKKLFKASMNENANFDVKLKSASSVWLEHIKTILEGTLQIVEVISQQKSSVVVHCSDGWDRTSQLCALAEVFLDSSYRTIVGLQILIEKEWLSFGHKFESRIGQGSKNDKSLEYSPVFLQFIDCLWQIQQQNPDAFEFNSRYLQEILHHLYSCRFGTFLFDNEQERTINNVTSKTVSLWSYINKNSQPYLNTTYREVPGLLIVDCSNLKLWKQYYLHWRDFHGL
ncbi:GRAM domain-containing protein [Tieghemostelium lacteum]|uniref:GRAM domain-containing protein n=1 Tax=Tieghemostelium lacteum TaxID=361077 RepID=A0A151ZKL8_TIELA|nr:GRAM domain-containing protein [Tieghemostelium lacteum]|eukprot:KYQ94455.1 GRAM domain-containing protein [Tieghemostelium lacteum]